MGIKEFWKYMITDPNKNKPKDQTKKLPNLFAKQNPKRFFSKSSDPIHETHDVKESTAKNKLGKAVILFILINSILGSSLFYLPGLGVKSSGAASLLIWGVVFLFATFLMMYIGELTVLHPSSGGTYYFCKKAYGRFLAFLAGWLIWIAGNLSFALNIVAAAEYFIPEPTQTAFIMRIIFAAIWIIVLNYLAFRGIDAGVTMLVAFGIFSVFVVLLLIVPSFINFPDLFQGAFSSPFNSNFLHPFFRHAGGWGLFSYFFFSFLLIMEGFFGFETITYLSNEVKEPQKLHKMLFWAMGICGVIVFIYILSSLGIVNYTDYVNDARPFAVQAINTMGPIGQNFVVFGMYLVIIGAAAAWPITGSRLIQAMARDKLFISQMAVRHKKHKSPYRAVYFQTIMITIFTWLVFRGYMVQWGDSYRTFYLIYVILTLVVLSLILFAVPILRRKEKDAYRSYKAPFPLAGPIIIVSFFLFLLWNWYQLEGVLATSIISIAGSFIILGIPFYFLVEMYYDPKAIMRVNEVLSYLVLWTEKIHFPFGIRNYILKRMKGIEGKIILEYGCGIGSLTTRLAKVVGPRGKVIATDISLHNVKVTNSRTKHHDHVNVHHHPYLDKFHLPQLSKLPNFDAVISIGTLSYLQKPAQVLKDLSEQIKKGAEVLFVDYDKFFYVIPNVAWISDDKKLVEMFASAGFRVQVVRKRSLLWTYIMIKGKKV